MRKRSRIASILAAATAMAAAGVFVAAPTASAGPSEVINPGFESGNANWQEYMAPFGGHIINNSSSWPAHSGNWKAELGGQGLAGLSRISQQVTIPGYRVPVLSFWMRCDNAPSGSPGFGFRELIVQATDENGVSYDLATRTNKDATGGSYEQVTVTLPDAFYTAAGQRANITFMVIEDASNRMPFLIDDVNMEYRYKWIKPPIHFPGLDLPRATTR